MKYISKCYKITVTTPAPTPAPTTSTFGITKTVNGVSYYSSNQNSVTCASGYGYITTDAQCTAAAKAFGQSSGYTSKNSWSQYPRGCFQYYTGKFYRNTHATGTVHSRSAIVCIKGATSAPTTSAPTTRAPTR